MTAWTRFGLALLVACAGAFGCKTAEPTGFDEMASVTIRGKSLAEIRQAVSAVFAQERFEVGTPVVHEMVFERKASGAATLLEGDWPGAGSGVWERIKVTTFPDKEDGWVVGCSAFLVTDHGEKYFEVEKKRSNARRRICQEMLAKVKARLAQNAGTAPP